MNETPKFIKGQRVRLVGMHDPSQNGREGKIVCFDYCNWYPGAKSRWMVKFQDSPGSFRSDGFDSDNLELVPETSKFKPGDRATIDDKNDLRHGQTVYLYGRRLGKIAGRPYWMVSDYPNDPSPWMTTFEDSLIAVPPEKTSPDLFSPSFRLDPREPEAVAMKAPCFHDGQANTSGIGQRQPEREDVLKKGDLVIVTGGWLKGEPGIIDGLFGSAEGKAIACYVKTKRCPGVGVVLRDDLKVASTNEFFVAMRSEPTVHTVQEGITRWQQADPTHRRANVVLGGHTVEVFLTVLPGLATQRVKFDSMFSADATVAILEDAAKAMVDHATAEVSVTMARNPAFKFSEDSGDIEP